MKDYDDFVTEVEEVCEDYLDNDNLDVQNEIVRILDNYIDTLSAIQLMLLIPAVLVRTGRDPYLKMSLVNMNGYCELKTQNFTFKIS